MTNDTNPDIVDKADTMAEVGFAMQAEDWERAGQAYVLLACALYGHRPEKGGVFPADAGTYRRERYCSRCKRQLSSMGWVEKDTGL